MDFVNNKRFFTIILLGFNELLFKNLIIYQYKSIHLSTDIQFLSDSFVHSAVDSVKSFILVKDLNMEEGSALGNSDAEDSGEGDCKAVRFLLGGGLI